MFNLWRKHHMLSYDDIEYIMGNGYLSNYIKMEEPSKYFIRCEDKVFNNYYDEADTIPMNFNFSHMKAEVEELYTCKNKDLKTNLFLNIILKEVNKYAFVNGYYMLYSVFFKFEIEKKTVYLYVILGGCDDENVKEKRNNDIKQLKLKEIKNMLDIS